MQMQL